MPKGKNKNRGSREERFENVKKGKKGESSSDVNEDGGEANQDIPSKPPPGLKGKALGLWYRDRNRTKQKKKKGQEAPKSIPLELPVKKQDEIRSILNQIKIPLPSSNESVSSAASLSDKYKHIGESEFKRRYIQSLTGTIQSKISSSLNSHLSYIRNDSLDLDYKEEFILKMSQPGYKDMLNFRRKLPAFEMKDEIINLVHTNQVVLISGETGCGKTTQVGQFILDNELCRNKGSTTHIVCTQPRRISAVSVAERVAKERGERLGHTVGYQIRLEKVQPRATGSILFCTTGILLQWMQNDPVLTNVSHIILDEIHERDTISDFIITILKDIIKLRKDLKVILMSATLNAEHFSKYFDDCPKLCIPGFTFPVTEYYLEDVLLMTGFKYKSDIPGSGGAKFKNKEFRNKKTERKTYEEQFLNPYLRSVKDKYHSGVLDALKNPESESINLDLIVSLLEYICTGEPEGAILVFLPGWDKISSLHNLLVNSSKFSSNRYQIIPLHSLMPTKMQKSVFDRPPHGVRKIVIATNIAETSITIDDIIYVIDCGKIKIKNFDIENNISTLKEEWVSSANARQRRGRAGRVQPGVCYHLYSKPREMTFSDFQLPEMLRTRLEEVILQVKVLQLGKIAPFLEKVMDPPNPKAVELSLKLLISMNALDNDENLTPLGFHLAHLPIDPQAGKMILFASLFGCLDPITSIAASLSFKDAFVIPLGLEYKVDQKKIELSKNTKSDHIVMAEALSGWRNAERHGSGRQYTSYYFLSHQTLTMLRDMKNQFIHHLYDMKFIHTKSVTSDQCNYNSDNIALVKAVICAGLYPNVAIIKKVKKFGKIGKNIVIMHTEEDGRVSLHPKSVNCYSPEFESRFLVYFEKMKSSEIFLHDTTMVFPLALIFFCHNFTIEDLNERKIIILNSKIRFSCEPSVAQLITELRQWLDWLLEYKVSHPGASNRSQQSDENLILRAIIELISSEYKLYLPENSDDNQESGDDGYDDNY